MLSNVSIILVRTRLPENIGMVARAMANMGVAELILVAPERWEIERALPLATQQGRAILESARIETSLAEALKPFTLAIATTARTGGWRTAPCSPELGAKAARDCSRHDGRVALVFGPEDCGLFNEDIAFCSLLVTVPTALENSSLNLAQAVLIVLYECVKADLALPFTPEIPRQWARPAQKTTSRRVTLEEEQMLLAKLYDTLVAIDYLPQENPEWFMRSLRRFLRKHALVRHEFSMLMGICKKIQSLMQ